MEEIARLRLPVDIRTSKLMTDEIDRSMVPRPGEPLPMRSALAKVVEAAISYTTETIRLNDEQQRQ